MKCGRIREKKPIKLKLKMVEVLILCWLVPLTVLITGVLYYVSDQLEAQIAETAVESMDNAVKICELRLESAATASRNASYVPRIKESWKQYLLDGNSQKLYESVTTFLEENYKYTDTLWNALVYFTQEPEKLYYTLSSDASREKSYSHIRQIEEEVLPLVRETSKVIDTGIGYVVYGDDLYMVRNIMDSTFEPYAVIITEINKEAVFQSLQSIVWYVDCEIYLDGEQIVKPLTGESFSYASSAKTSSKSQYRRSGQDAFMSCGRQNDEHKINYIVKLDGEAIGYEKNGIVYVIVVMLLFTLPLIAIVFYFLQSNVTQPVNALLDATKEIAEGHFGYQMESAHKSEEFSYLEQNFNAMSDKLKNQFEQIYQEELALRDANIAALQSQINPHFLNNTLEIINWSARMGENEKVCKMIEALSTMMEATMNRKKQQLIPLSEELSYVEAYSYIIKERFGDKIQFEYNVDDAFLRVEIPRLIIQPIVENAVEHGLGNRAGTVTINVFSHLDKLKIEIINTGLMLPSDKQRVESLLSDVDGDNADLQHSVSLGIRNVNKRLKIIYGSDCGLTIANNNQGCTVSTLTVRMYR